MRTPLARLRNNSNPMLQHVYRFIAVHLALCMVFIPTLVIADNAGEPPHDLSLFWAEIEDGFDTTINALVTGAYKQPATATQNPHNDFLNTRQYRADLELRPDFNLTYRRLELMAKPRARYTWEKRDNDNQAAETWWSDDFRFIEYRIRVGLTDDLFASYGRENLQWGPTILYSPSNPFFQKTGRSSSQTELNGKGFARLVYIPNLTWTISLIANVDEGPDDQKTDNFETIYAVKVDTNGSMGYASMIVSHEEDVGNSIGMFGAWNILDHSLVYVEGELSKENSAFYPARNHRHPMGGDLTSSKQNDNAYDGALITGGTHTFDTMITLSLEYMYNSRGYSDSEADDFFTIRRNAAEAYDAGPYRGLARRTLGKTAKNGLRYWREHYLFLNISRRDILDVLDIRYQLAYNLDDTSSRSIFNIDYGFNDHTEFFFNGVYHDGPTDSEFTSFFDYKCSIGIKYSF